MALFRRWLRRWHGEGEAHQHQFYRCLLCHGVVTWRHIRQGGCKCGSSRIRPSNLRLAEKARLLLLPWTV